MSGENKELYDNLARLIETTNKNQTIELKEQIQLEVIGLKHEITEIKDIIAEEAGKRNQLEKRQLSLESKHEHFERIIKKNNVLVFGLKCDNHENLTEFTLAKLNSLLELSLTLANINNIFQLSKKDENGPILVQFISFLTKLQVLKNCKKLKGSGISISDDLTKEQRKIRQALVKHKKWAQSKGYKAYIKKNKLYVNDEIYTYEKLVENQQINITEEAQTSASTFQNKKNNSAPATPSAKEYYETDGEEIGAEEEITDDGEERRLETDINEDTANIETSEIKNKESSTSNLKGKSLVSNSNIKKRKPEAICMTEGPITRRFKKIQENPTPKKTLDRLKDRPNYSRPLEH